MTALTNPRFVMAVVGEDATGSIVVELPDDLVTITASGQRRLSTAVERQRLALARRVHGPDWQPDTTQRRR